MLIRPRNRIRMPAKSESPKGDTARVGETLTADAGGLTGAPFAYQWLSNDAEIAGATVFERRSSEDFPGRLPYKKLKDEALRATNGRVVGAARVASGQNQRWTIRVRPGGQANPKLDSTVKMVLVQGF